MTIPVPICTMHPPYPPYPPYPMPPMPLPMPLSGTGAIPPAPAPAPASATAPSRAGRIAGLGRLARCTALALTLAACGGGSGDDPTPVDPPPPAPPPAGNQAPTAVFTLPTSVVAGTPLSLDGRASTDPEGGALVHAWDFGDGHLGGQARIAHVWSMPGRYTVRLRVADPLGASGVATREIEVTPAAAPPRSVRARGHITDGAGAPLAGATVRAVGGSATGTSDADGRVALDVGAGAPVVLAIERAGYTGQVKRLDLPASAGSDAGFSATLLPRATALTLPDAAAGGSLLGARGARLTLPANALVDAASGAAVTGAVQVTMTPIDVGSAPAAFPGRFEGVDDDGTRGPIVSYGTVEFDLMQGGRRLQLAPGARAVVELPLFATVHASGTPIASGSTIELWSLDEASGLWIGEGSGTVVASSDTPLGLALRADVGHFSWWNADRRFTPWRPKPRCINDVPGQYDSLFEQATLCKMLAEMDRPIPPQVKAAGASRPIAADPPASAPRFPALRVEADLPMSGGVTIDAYPDTDMRFVATLLEGTWRGEVVARGSQGAGDELPVRLRPVAAGAVDETITLPFDQVRAAARARIDRYRMSLTAGAGYTVTLGRADGSSLEGTLRVRDAAGSLVHSGPFGVTDARMESRAVAAGVYTVEVDPASPMPAAYRLRVALDDTAQGRMPAQVLSGSGSTAQPKVATNALGESLAVWPETSNGLLVLRASRWRSAAAGWSTPDVIANLDGWTPAVGFQVGLDDAGTATVAWDQSGPRVVRRRDADSAWTAPDAPASGACPGGLAQALAVDGDGAALLAWQRRDNPGLCVRLRRADGSWAEERVLASDGSTTAAGALALALRGGRGVAVWSRADGSTLAAARFDAAGNAWTDPVAVAGSALWPAVSIAPSGNALLAWYAGGAINASLWPVSEPLRAATRLGDSGGSGTVSAAWRGGERFSVAWNSFNQGPRSRDHDGTAWGSVLPIGAESLVLLVGHAADATGAAAAVAGLFRNGRNELVAWRSGRGGGDWVEAGTVAVRPLLVRDPRYPETASIAMGNGQAAVVAREAPSAGGVELQVTAARVAVP